MSADNWTICPKCRANDEARELLGDPDRTMREDWEIGLDKFGEFEVNYSCACRRCGFTFKYSYTKSVAL